MGRGIGMGGKICDVFDKGRKILGMVQGRVV